tara:strand:- start:678 stop:944 length:267 start_codon:yes stop_codon:yes gene_type:complete
MAEIAELNDLKELEGTICTYNLDESNEWTDKNTIKCVVERFSFVLEKSFPYTLTVLVHIDTMDMKYLDTDLSLELYNEGTNLDNVIFI